MNSLTRIAILVLLGLLLCFVAARSLAPSTRPNRPTKTSRIRATTQQPAAPASDTRGSLIPQLELDELLKPTPPKEPADALAAIETIPGFHVELAAHEPDVVDPVAAAFDEQGRLFVTEMRDYPFRPQTGEKPIGRVRMLVDTDGDGRFEHSTTYADELLWPTGVVCWKQGIFVAAAPNIYYFKDHDGDGVADERRIVYAGFGTQNEQGSVNNLAWALDGKIYATTSKNGGQIRREGDADTAPVGISGRDICFDPTTEKFELVSGGGQFGNAFDDWGNRFLCDQSNPSMEVMLPNRYLARNPLLAVPTAINDLTPGATQIFRISPLEGWRVVRSTRRLKLGERSENSTGLNHHVLDGVAGLMIYRGDAFPAEFRGNLIVGDGQTNLIHRRLLVPDGVTFRSVRADADTEFVRSRDIWFRPVNALNAPDGCVYVTDMAREVIESVHVPWDVVRRINLKSQGRGRIWRIAPNGFQSPAPPRLAAATTEQLVALLAHRGGWWRDAAQRLLYERQDPSAVPLLQKLLRESTFDLARMHALYALSQMGSLADTDLHVGLADRSAGVREHAVRLSESRLSSVPDLLARVAELAHDESPRVRMQVAFSLGETTGSDANQRQVVAGLSAVSRLDGGDPWTRTAILSSCSGRSEAVLRTLLIDAQPATESAASADVSHTQSPPCDPTLLRQLAYMIGREESHDDRVPQLLNALAEANADRRAVPAVLLGLSEGLRGSKSTLQELQSRSSAAATALVQRTVAEAQELAANPQSPAGARAQAISILSCGTFSDVAPTLEAILAPHEPEMAQRAAVQALAAFNDPAVARLLIAPWRRYTPGVRAIVVQALFAQPARMSELLTAIEQGDVPANQLTRVERNMLLALHDKQDRSRAEKLFETDHSPRQDIYDRYRPALQLNANLASGEKIYQRECMSCHQVGQQGHAVGPNLALTKHRAPEELLLHILDPNREVQPAFVQYSVVDRSGAIYSGLLAADTASSITLRRDKNIEQTVLKSEIDELVSSDKSLMPEGFEKTIPLQEMADLLAFLKELHYDIGTQPGRREGGD